MKRYIGLFSKLVKDDGGKINHELSKSSFHVVDANDWDDAVVKFGALEQEHGVLLEAKAGSAPF